MVTERVKLAESDAEIASCFPVMKQLRPHLEETAFVAQVRAQQAQGFQMAFLQAAGKVVAVGGFRVTEVLASARTLYVDDLITDEAQRSRGYGRAVLDWLQEYARKAGCVTFSLDSGTHRQEAHAFYFREGMRVTSFHFAKKLT